MAVGASLVALLGLDSTNYTKGLDKASGKATEFQKKASKNFKKAGAGLAGIFSVAVIKGLSTDADALVKQFDKVGFRSFESFQRIQFGLEQAGVAQAGFVNSTTKLNKAILDSNNGMKTYQRDFNAIGLSWEELDKMAPEDRFLEVLGAINKVEDAGKKAALTQSLLGRAFKEVAVNVDDVVQAGDSLGAVVSEEAARKAEETNDKINQFITTLKNFATNSLPILVAAIEKLAGVFKKIALSLGLIEPSKLEQFGESIQNLSDSASSWGGMRDFRQGVVDLSKSLVDGKITVEEFEKGVEQSFNSLSAAGQRKAKDLKENVLAELYELKTEAVGNSIVPDMVIAIEGWLDRMVTSGGKKAAEFKTAVSSQMKQAFMPNLMSSDQFNFGKFIKNGLDEAAKHSKKAFQLNKNIAIAEATINTFTGMTKALAQGGIFGPVLAAVVGAAGFAQVAAISSQQYQGLATGGTVTKGGGFLVGERGPEMVNLPAGAAVTPNGGSSNVTINVSGNLDERAINQIRQVIRTSPKDVGQSANYFARNSRGVR